MLAHDPREVLCGYSHMMMKCRLTGFAGRRRFCVRQARRRPQGCCRSQSGARTLPRRLQGNVRTQSNMPIPCPCGRAPRKNAALCRLQPPAERRRYKGVSRESKEGVGETRNPPIPPWPPEAATRLRPRATAAQGCTTQPARQRQNAKQHAHPLPLRQSAA